MSQKIGWWSTDLSKGEAEAAAEAIRARHISQGPITADLEARVSEKLGVKHAIAVPNGSMGLLLSMLALDVGPGDEVIVPALTWIASAHGAAILGAKIVLVDCVPDKPLLDPEKLKAAITPKTKAIIPVHLAGRSVDMEPVLKVAKDYGVAVVEDAAQALGSRNRDGYLGTQGDIGIYSLGLAKLVAAGQGGLVVTNRDDLNDKMRLCTRHGTEHIPADDYRTLGLNMKVTDVLSAIAMKQFERLDEKRAHVTAVYQTYADSVDVLPCDVDGGEVPLWTEIQVPNRERVIAYLAEHGIESRRQHVPLFTADHLFETLPEPKDFPNATRLSKELLILPSGPDQPLDNVKRVVDLLKRMD